VVTTGTAGPERADTIVLIHGVWLTAGSWEHWAAYYRQAGYDVLAPAYPGLDDRVEALRADPTPIGRLTFQDTAAGYEAIIRSLDKPPIIIGHCVGGTLVQSCSTADWAPPASPSAR
jgi:pimeloyl-ACP methyl ester carboxylesterase